MTELLKDGARRLSEPWKAKGYRAAGLHVYRDPSGAEIFAKFRLEHPDGDKAPDGRKIIRPIHVNGDGRCAIGEPRFGRGTKPLYRLPRIVEKSDGPVWIVEGEKDADALVRLGAVATTSGSATSDDAADWSPLAGRTCYLWPDNDDEGRAYAGRVAVRLLRLGCQVQLLDVPPLGLPAKGGADDWVKSRQNATLCDLEALPRISPHPTPQNVPQAELGGREWLAPGQITAVLPPVPTFDAMLLLPSVLRTWVTDEADRMPCPSDYVAAAALVALGSTIGARCAIKPKARDSWVVVPNLWGGIVGLPSAKKSPAIAAAIKPLDKLAAAAHEKHAEALIEFAADKAIHEARCEALESDIKKQARLKDGHPEQFANLYRQQRQQAPAPPTARRFKTNDPTTEKLGELLRENPAGLLVLRDELVGLVASWEREGREGDRAFFLEAWNGTNSFDTDRIGRGSILIPNLCLSVFGGIQPDKLTQYLEEASHALGNDGMLQRFQVLVYPNNTKWEWRDRAPDHGARERVFGLFETLANLDPMAFGANAPDETSRIPYFRFDAAAQEVFIEWTHDLQTIRIPREQQEGQPIIAQHLAKFEKLLPAIALILHLTDCVHARTAGPVTEEAALRAAAWCEYLEAHARRCYGLLADEGLRAAQSLSDRLRRGQLANGFTAREVRRNRWRYLTTDEGVRVALEWLEDENWIRAESIGGIGPGSGRRTYRYQINPKILETAPRPAANAAARPLTAATAAPHPTPLQEIGGAAHG